MSKASTISAVAALVAVYLWPVLDDAQAASHREAPLIAEDPTADITDVYAFRSWQNTSNVVFIMNVIPAQEPSSGPNYFNFDDEVVYQIHVDTDQDGVADDVVYRVEFFTELRTVATGFPVSYAAVPPITALKGPGSGGIGLRQTYTVTRIAGNNRTDLRTETVFAVPSNVGPLTMPDYEALAAQGFYALSNGGQVFAGQRDETFYIDLGATFDTVNLRRTPPILSDGEDANDGVNPFGVDAFSGFNVNSIVIEVPISELSNGAGEPVLGVYASTSRRRGLDVDRTPGQLRQRIQMRRQSQDFEQVARMGNPLVNELIIPTASKDAWNAAQPENEQNFVNFYQNPSIVSVINLRFGTSFPDSGRTDLVGALLQYGNSGDCAQEQCSELLRLDTSVQPVAPANQSRLGVLGGDNAGFPNGRRPNDDVTDIVLRVAAGALLGDVPALGDGVNFNIGSPGSGVTAEGIETAFPYLPTPHDGRDSRHIDCDESGANAC